MLYIYIYVLYIYIDTTSWRNRTGSLVSYLLRFFSTLVNLTISYLVTIVLDHLLSQFYCSEIGDVGSHMSTQRQCHLLTCQYTAPAVRLVHMPDDGLFNPKHVATASFGDSGYMFAVFRLTT